MLLFSSSFFNAAFEHFRLGVLRIAQILVGSEWHILLKCISFDFLFYRYRATLTNCMLSFYRYRLPFPSRKERSTAEMTPANNIFELY